MLSGGAGADTMIGGSGGGFDHDKVGDLTIGQDRIQFDDAMFADFAAVQAAMQQVGADTVITFGPDDSITLQNVNAASLAAGDFLLV